MKYLFLSRRLTWVYVKLSNLSKRSKCLKSKKNVISTCDRHDTFLDSCFLNNEMNGRKEELIYFVSRVCDAFSRTRFAWMEEETKQGKTRLEHWPCMMKSSNFQKVRTQYLERLFNNAIQWLTAPSIFMTMIIAMRVNHNVDNWHAYFEFEDNCRSSPNNSFWKIIQTSRNCLTLKNFYF